MSNDVRTMTDETRDLYDNGHSTGTGTATRIEEQRPATSRRTWARGHDDTQTGEDVMTVRNRVQWGPILAGVLTSIATLLLLTVLGLAIGASALEPRDVGESLGVGAAIWGGLSAIIALFVGGWVAAKTAAVGGPGSGMINGLMVGVTILALLLYLAGSGVAGIIGTLGSNLGDVANISQSSSQVDSQQAFENVRDSAWGTFIGLLLPLIAATLGGYLGHNKRRDLIGGTG